MLVKMLVEMASKAEGGASGVAAREEFGRERGLFGRVKERESL